MLRMGHRTRFWCFEAKKATLTKPDDLMFDLVRSSFTTGNRLCTSRWLQPAMGDGSVRFLKDTIDVKEVSIDDSRAIGRDRQGRRFMSVGSTIAVRPDRDQCKPKNRVGRRASFRNRCDGANVHHSGDAGLVASAFIAFLLLKSRQHLLRRLSQTDPLLMQGRAIYLVPLRRVPRTDGRGDGPLQGNSSAHPWAI